MSTESRRGKNSKERVPMRNFNCRFTLEDIAKIRAIKDDMGIRDTVDLFRYFLLRECEKIRERQERNKVNINAEALMESSLKGGNYIHQERVPIYRST